MEGDIIDLHGRKNFNSLIKATTQTDNPGDHFFPLRFGQVPTTREMCNRTKEIPPIFRLELSNLNNGGNYDSDKKKNETQAESLYSNDKREVYCNNQTFCFINWRNQLSSVLVPTNISLNEYDQQPQNQSNSKGGLDSSLDLILTTEANEDDWGYDFGKQQRVNNGHWSIAWLMESTFKQLEGISSSINISKIVKENNIIVENQTYTTEDRQHNNRIINLQMEGSFSNASFCIQNETADALIMFCWIGDYKIKPDMLKEALLLIDFHPTLNTFALRLNKQLNRYCSSQDDWNAFEINSMNILWKEDKFRLYLLI
ncbi:MAG: hypothetical protein EZS28_022076 [Streblomastix strix]|uniref:Uncharacterized protein n=1 Tax=Streblomastix strix TaxID=222440 RepID=A0A5J4VID6_9EUKA|nr:MAG: hypothetical protein EZS28_022076 [Streblomastix strix]